MSASAIHDPAPGRKAPPPGIRCVASGLQAAGAGDARWAR